ncbi:MAG TPA: hypothetical protein VF715_17840 [Thermoleophilaceae bacterium]
MDSRTVTAALTFVLLLAAIGVFSGDARAAEDGGWAESNTNLAIRPAPNYPVEQPLTTYKPIMFVQMPVTKHVKSVELGDLGVGTACTTTTMADLKIEEHRDSEPFGTADSTVISDAPVQIPVTPGKMKWSIPPMRMEKGVGYAFKVVARQPASGCAGKYTTWKHDRPSVVGGTNGCREPAAAVGGTKIIWPGTVTAALCNVDNYDSSMPEGWLHTVPDPYLAGHFRVGIRAADSRTPSGIDGPCMDQSNYKWGGRWKYWRYVSSTGKHEWVCTRDQYRGFGEDVEPASKEWHYALPWPSQKYSTTVTGGPRDMHVTLEAIDYNVLIGRHKPTMRYSADENYFADAAESITNYSQNRLMRATSVGADHLDYTDAEDLDLGDLGSSYGGYLGSFFGQPSTEDFLDEGGDPQTASAEMRGQGHGDRMYGRAVYGSDGKLWLQYWFFYYYNDFWGAAGNHEGDWEMIQVGLDSSLAPDVVTYATHDSGSRCTFANTQSPDNPASPMVYVARGSHASYWEWGETAIPGWNPAVDHHYGDRPFSPQPTLTTVTGELNFWGWPGYWGGDLPALTQGGHSPKAPQQQQPKWSNPSAFYSEAEPCLAGARKRKPKGPRVAPASTRGLPVPAIERVSRTRSRATVRYSVKPDPRIKEPLFVQVVVQPRNPRNPSRTEVRPLKPGKQTVQVLLPPGGGPYRVEARVLDRSNRFGREVTRALP